MGQSSAASASSSPATEVVCAHCDAVVRVPAARLGDGPKCPRCHQALFGGHPVSLTSANFDRHVGQSGVPVVVDFWAPWCGPCRMVAPILEKLAQEWAGRVKIAKVNVDENSVYAGRYGVQAIPTMLVVQNGRIVDQWAGALPEGAMRSRLARIL